MKLTVKSWNLKFCVFGGNERKNAVVVAVAVDRWAGKSKAKRLSTDPQPSQAGVEAAEFGCKVRKETG